MVGLIIQVLALLFVLLCCEGGSFTSAGRALSGGSGGHKSESNKDEPKGTGDAQSDDGPLQEGDDDSDGGAEQSDLGSGDGDAEPKGLETSDGEVRAVGDLETCAALPEAGRSTYGKCPAQAAIVVINDGKGQQMTCCPFKGENILASDPAKTHVRRSGQCGTDEVATGLISPDGPEMYCTALNGKLRLGAQVPIIYAKSDSALDETMRAIAASYNVLDTCICPRGTFYVGTHTTNDNVCIDKCAPIEKR